MITQPLLVDDPASSELRARVVQFLASQHFASFRKLEVMVFGDRVVLHGCIPTFHERQLAVALCQHVAGVHQVVDQLIVPEAVPAEPLERQSPDDPYAGDTAGARGVRDTNKRIAFGAIVRQSVDDREIRPRPK